MAKIVKLKNETLTIERCEDCPMLIREHDDDDYYCMLGFYSKMEDNKIRLPHIVSVFCKLDDKEDDKNG